MSRFFILLSKRILTKRKLFHPHIIKLYGVTDKNPRYLVSEFVEGGDLSQWIERRYPIPIELIDNPSHQLLLLKIIQGISFGLDYLHSKNILHLDLKLQNIVLSKKRDFLSTLYRKLLFE